MPSTSTARGFDLSSTNRLRALANQAAESILGPDLMAWGVSFFIEEPNDDRVVTWHQDPTCWGFGET